ncbi:MAG: hypothetical protein R3F48_03965 [Candidatus Zixiibacteriota bacterium]
MTQNSQDGSHDELSKHHAKTIWKLVDAKCYQLKEAVSAARIPFVLTLIWAFVWFAAIYNHEFSYTTELLKRVELAQMKAEDIGHWRALNSISLKRYYPELFADSIYSQMQKVFEQRDSIDAIAAKNDTAKVSAETLNRMAKNILDTLEGLLIRQQVESWKINLPFLELPVTCFDYGVIGHMGLTLLMLWFCYASRRENRAIRSFVDITDIRGQSPLFPKRYVLNPEQNFLEPEHYSYAYQSVAHRFMFFVSTKSSPMIWATIGLILLPTLVATWHWYTDFRDLITLPGLGYQANVRVLIETPIFFILIFFTLKTLRLAINTGVILNGWYLADLDVWGKQWNESTTNYARPVVIYRDYQRAEQDD